MNLKSFNYSNFPYSSKSSLQLDVEHHNNPTEKQDLVDFVIENGKAFDVDVSHYKQMNKKIWNNKTSTRSPKTTGFRRIPDTKSCCTENE